MGISKIETLCYDIMADKEAGRSNYSFFKNNAIPSTIIYLDNDMDEAEQKIALEQLKNQFSG
jgi:phage portal protein BeeE